MDRDPFFVNIVIFQNSRFSHEHVAAQLTLLTINGDICDIKDRNLNAMYMDNQDFDSNGDVAKKIKKVLNYLVLMFPEKIPELKRYNVVSMFSLVKDLMENYAKKDRETELARWFVDFETKRAMEAEKPEDEQDPRLAIYQSKTNDSTDAMDSLRYRHEFLKENLLVLLQIWNRKMKRETLMRLSGRLFFVEIRAFVKNVEQNANGMRGKQIILCLGIVEEKQLFQTVRFFARRVMLEKATIFDSPGIIHCAM